MTNEKPKVFASPEVLKTVIGELPAPLGEVVQRLGRFTRAVDHAPQPTEPGGTVVATDEELVAALQGNPDAVMTLREDGSLFLSFPEPPLPPAPPPYDAEFEQAKPPMYTVFGDGRPPELVPEPALEVTIQTKQAALIALARAARLDTDLNAAQYRLDKKLWLSVFERDATQHKVERLTRERDGCLTIAMAYIREAEGG